MTHASMPRIVILFALGAVTAIGACNRHRYEYVVTPVGRTVFTDSALHAEQCEVNRPGESWRKVCTPKDQGVRPSPRP